MQRYIVAPSQMDRGTVTVAGEDAFHIVKVMRMRQGDKIIASNGQSREVIAVLNTLSSSEVVADIVEEREWTPEPAWLVSIAQGLPKGDKMELVIQKGTEIGAASFVPFESERMIVQYDGKKAEKRLERWSRIAKEAAEQAHRGSVPPIAPVHSWKQLLQRFADYDLVLFCYEKRSEASKGLRDALLPYRERQQLRVLLIVGPEGGFTEQEADQAEEAGAVLAGLGRRILRTETAGMAALACLLYEAGEMGGR